MNATAIKAMMAELAPVISEYVAAELADARAEVAALKAANLDQAKRVAALEARELPSLEGYVTVESVKSLITDAVSAAIAEIPAPQDGKSIEPIEVQAMVDKAVAALPAPQKGDKGLGVKDILIAREGQLVATFDDGSTKNLGRVVGKDAEPLPVDPEQLAGIVRAEVEKAVAALPDPEPVVVEPREVDMDAIGKMIADGITKAVSELPTPEKGESGIGLAGAMIDRDGNLIITTSDGQPHNLGLVVGKDGDAGETFSLDDFDIEQTGERVIELKFLRGNTMHSFELEFPVPIFRGAWKEGTWSKGDMVVWGGSLWAATKDTDAKPDAPDSGWMIAARKGRDGKDKM